MPKAVVIEKPGNYDKLQIRDVEIAPPGPKDVVVSIRAAGVNYADVLVRWGLYSSAKEFVGWPITPGFEFSGVIEQVGSSVTKFKVGEAVVGITLFNSYAEKIRVNEEYLFPMPKGPDGKCWSFAQAAALPAVNLTAYHALFQNVVIRPGANVMIHSAAGGVGSALVQVCKIAGFRSVGVVGRSSKVAACRELGCDDVIDKSSEDLWKRAEELVPEGYDVILDANGVSTLGDSYKHLRTRGKLLVYGFHSMLPKEGGRINYLKLVADYVRTPRFNPLDMTDKNKSVVTFNISYLWEQIDLIQEAMGPILKWISEGRLKPVHVQTFALADVAKAHQAIESGTTVGKLVLLPDPNAPEYPV